MAQDCSRCSIKGVCTKANGNRVYEVNLNLIKQKQLIRELLISERGLMHRSKRPIEPEAVFGQIKYDSGFKRFMLKSLPKVSVEFGLVALAHNLRKYASNLHSIDEKIPKKPRYWIDSKLLSPANNYIIMNYETSMTKK